MKPVRILTAGAAVVALTIASVGTTVAQDEAGAAAWFEGTVTFAPSCSVPTTTDVDGVRQQRGYSCAPQTWQTDDDRFGGTAEYAWHADVHRVGTASYSVIASRVAIDGATGGWVCHSTNSLDEGAGLFTTPVQGTDRLTCVGNGENAGLSAIAITDFRSEPFTVEGLIFPGELAPLPELATND